MTVVFRLIEFDGDGILLKLVGTVQYTIRPQMFIFFYLGYALRNGIIHSLDIFSPKKNNTFAEISLFLVAFAMIEIMLYFNYQSLIDVGCYLALNLFFVLLVVRLFLSDIEIKNRFIEFIGRNSLPIYLWHVASILIIKLIIGTDQIFIYYLANAAVFIFEVFAVLLLNNIPFVRKYFFGNVQ